MLAPTPGGRGAAATTPVMPLGGTQGHSVQFPPARAAPSASWNLAPWPHSGHLPAKLMGAYKPPPPGSRCASPTAPAAAAAHRVANANSTRPSSPRPGTPAGISARTVLADTISRRGHRNRSRVSETDLRRHLRSLSITYNAESGLWPLIIGAVEARAVALNVALPPPQHDVPSRFALARPTDRRGPSPRDQPALLGPAGRDVDPHSDHPSTKEDPGLAKDPYESRPAAPLPRRSRPAAAPRR